MITFQLPTLESERLTMRQITENDLDLIIQLNQNLEVMRYITGKTESIEECKKALARYLSFPAKANLPVGMWVTKEKATGKLIGWHILKRLDETGELEIGYRLLPEFCGKGYATEGGKRLVEYATRDLKIFRIVGITHLENDASGRVLEKIGLKLEQIGTFYGQTTKYYAVSISN